MYKMIDRKQFHRMNATVETLRFDDGMTVKRLVSYSSVVCDVFANQVYLYPRHQYSPTTVRQLTRFLSEYAPLDGRRWNIALIREAMRDVKEYGHASVDRYDVSFHPHVLGTTLRW